jgi:hypothetical protein
MTYADKLRDPKWQKKRLQILERDDWKCCACHDSKTTLQVHHLFYARKDPWDYPDKAYQTLCEPCHKFRQEVADRAAARLKLWLATKSNDEIQDVAATFLEGCEGGDEPDHVDDNRNPDQKRDDALFRKHLIATMDRALAAANQPDAVIHYGLLTDLMMGLFSCNIFREPEIYRRAETLLAMAGEKLEGIK